MKLPVLFVLCIACLPGYTQSVLVPGKESFEQKWVKSSVSNMMLYSVKDGTKTEIGRLTTQILVGNSYMIIVARAVINGMKMPWVDSSFADAATLRPVKHSSHNLQRDMVLHFGKIVTGFYDDKMKQTSYAVRDTVTTQYFDSNLYPALLGWLPLAEGYTRDIAIYDFNPDTKGAVLKASVKQVESGIYQTDKSGPRAVWVVKVTDQIANGKNGTITYYFDKADRRLWKQELNTGGQQLLLKLAE